MAENTSSGYDKDKYYEISAKEGLPKRCPILYDCCRAVWTRYVLGFLIGNNKISFNEFIESQKQRWEPDSMIIEIEQLEWGSSAILFYVQNTCPEVTLFEPEYLPRPLTASAFGETTYFVESKRSEVISKHYSECAEFSKYAFNKLPQQIKKGISIQKRKRSHISKILRFEIYNRDGFRCHYCKRHKDELPVGVSLTLDHKVPYVDGGEDSFNNLITACSECNGGKSNKILKDI